MPDPGFFADLKTTVDAVLLDGMHPGLRASVHELVGKGYSKRQIMAFVRSRCPKGRGKLVQAAVEAAIDEAKRMAN